MYSGFRFTKIGQDWKIRSMVLTFPSLEISFKNTEGVADRSLAGTCNGNQYSAV